MEEDVLITIWTNELRDILAVWLAETYDWGDPSAQADEFVDMLEERGYG